MRNLPAKIAPLILALCLLLSACGESLSPSADPAETPVTQTQEQVQEEQSEPEPEPEAEPPAEPEAESEEPAATETGSSEEFSLELVPAYSGDAWVAIHDNQPYFTEDDLTTESFETYSDLDELGRCGVAYANICVELMPTEARESISSVTPSGWVNNQYDCVDGGWLYNRCHLIGFQLAGENANPCNLITGTRYLNIDGMLSFENMVADYVKETEQHVLYRVTPVFEGDNLLAAGVLMEGLSVEDGGEDICFCVFAYNVQPGVELDYATGENWLSGGETSAGEDSSEGAAESIETSTESAGEADYVLNLKSMKFHLPDCSGVASMSEGNKEYYTGTREELIERGYSPCGICNP